MTGGVRAPFIGETVHYVSHGTPVRPDGSQVFPARCRAAIVTEVGRDERGVWASLCVLNPTGQFFQEGLHPDLDHPHAAGTWHPVHA